jgi:hypothetical protein
MKNHGWLRLELDVNSALLSSTGGAILCLLVRGYRDVTRGGPRARTMGAVSPYVRRPRSVLLREAGAPPIAAADSNSREPQASASHRPVQVIWLQTSMDDGGQSGRVWQSKCSYSSEVQQRQQPRPTRRGLWMPCDVARCLIRPHRPEFTPKRSRMPLVRRILVGGALWRPDRRSAWLAYVPQGFGITPRSVDLVAEGAH